MTEAEQAGEIRVSLGLFDDALARIDATTWRITLTGNENTQIEYKYALGSWDFVEKDGTCGEVANRQLTLSYGANGQQTVNDTVPNWRNVPPCGN